MTSREKKLAAVLGVLMIGGVGGIGGYFGIVAPLQARNRAAAEAENEAADKENQLAKLRKDLIRLADAKKRSLPSDLDLARQEYETALGRLLIDAKIPKGYTLRSKSVENRAVPELAPKKPAYQRIGAEITMKKVDLAGVSDFLRRFYDLNLLHQVTKLQIKRTEEAGTSTSTSSRSRVADKPDLDVTIAVEAIVLEGAESRRSLLPVPFAFGAMLGSGGYHALANNPTVARGLTPHEFSPVLAVPDREYAAILAKDVFHGPPPPPPPVRVEKKREPEPEPEPPPVIKEDIAEFIKLTGITQRSDGTATVDIRDAANKLDYEVELKYVEGKSTAKVRKFYYIKDRRKIMDSGDVLEISDDTSSTSRKFRVLGLDGAALILASRDGAAKETPKRPSGFGGRRPTAPPVAPASAILGGVGASVYPLPVEKYFRWDVGQSLRQLRPLSADDAKPVLERLAPGTAAPVAATTPIPLAPLPRTVAEPGEARQD